MGIQPAVPPEGLRFDYAITVMAVGFWAGRKV